MKLPDIHRYTNRRYEEGLVTATEVANAILLHAISEPEIDANFGKWVQMLPVEVRSQLYSLLKRIQQADYQWNPFFLGPPNGANESPDYSTQLRRICLLLEIN